MSQWRGPFTVSRLGAGWRIVNAHGDTERVGYREKADADTVCRLMNTTFVCPKCGRASYHPKDLAERYCGACHQFFPDDDAGRRIDQYMAVPAVGVPLDMGWAIGVLNADDTFTRTCKGCGVRVTTAVNAAGDVDPAPIQHGDNCPVYARLGNNPALS